MAGKESSPFQVWMGVRHSCSLSPWLFNIFIDRRVPEARSKFYSNVRLTTANIELLLFANDLMMMAESEETLQHNMQELNSGG